MKGLHDKFFLSFALSKYCNQKEPACNIVNIIKTNKYEKDIF